MQQILVGSALSRSSGRSGVGSLRLASGPSLIREMDLLKRHDALYCACQAGEQSNHGDAIAASVFRPHRVRHVAMAATGGLEPMA
jgi:hypothetical protein